MFGHSDDLHTIPGGFTYTFGCGLRSSAFPLWVMLNLAQLKHYPREKSASHRPIFADPANNLSVFLSIPETAKIQQK
jgi:hypothetical protein